MQNFPQIHQDPFLGQLPETNMQMGGAQAKEPQRQHKDIERTYFPSLSFQVEIPVSWQLERHFASVSGE